MLIKNLVGIKNTYTDHVGLEFEIEGVNIPNNVPGWRVENDGSLRGESITITLLKSHDHSLCTNELHLMEGFCNLYSIPNFKLAHQKSP